MKPELDEISGQQTTGHEWNGIKELNTPVPRAFLIALWLTIAWSVLIWLLYPTWPFISDYTKGLLGHSSRHAVLESVAEGKAQKIVALAPFENMEVAELAKLDELQEAYEPSISVLYQDNCAACHGRDLSGQKGFPNLTDDHWLWSGTPEEIEYTLKVGINSNHEDTRIAQMLAYGRDQMLEREQIADVVEHVLKLSGQTHDADRARRGAETFAKNCNSCHGDDGQGGLETGAPSLTDAAWIYGGDRDHIYETVYGGRVGHMPHWDGRLSKAEIRMLTLYLIWAGQADDNG